MTCLLAGVLIGTAARAEESARPWAERASDEAQSRARELFAAGNELLRQNLFAPALDRYREAIEHWDHPAVRYNIAVALINLERPIEAYENLEAALRYGGDPLGPEVARQARLYRRLLERQIVHFTVECSQADVSIAVDGRDFLSCPGEREALVLPGEHQLTAERPGFLTRRVSLALTSGEPRRIRVELMSLEEATVEHRRWAAWKPWAVVGGGVAIGLAGLGFELQSRATFQSYDDAIAVLCAEMPCAEEELPEVVTAAHQRAERQNRIGVGLLATGGAVLGAGIVLAILNRPERERLDYDDQLSLAPSISRETVGLAASWKF